MEKPDLKHISLYTAGALVLVSGYVKASNACINTIQQHKTLSAGGRGGILGSFMKNFIGEWSLKGSPVRSLPTLALIFLAADLTNKAVHRVREEDDQGTEDKE